LYQLIKNSSMNMVGKLCVLCMVVVVVKMRYYVVKTREVDSNINEEGKDYYNYEYSQYSDYDYGHYEDYDYGQDHQHRDYYEDYSKSGKITVKNWEESLLNNLVSDKITEAEKIVIITYLNSQPISKVLEKHLDAPETTKEYLIDIYENKDKPSCAKTAHGLLPTFAKDFKASRPHLELIPWKEAKSTIKKNLKKKLLGSGRIVTVHMTAPSTCGDHYFTMWREKKEIGIVHGYQGLFAAKVIYHKNWATLENILNRMFKPFDVIYPNKKDKTKENKKKTVRDRLKAFKELFGATLNGYVEQLQWLTNTELNDPVFKIINIYHGKPSSQIVTIAGACKDIKYLDEMTKTKKICSNHVERINE